MTQFQYRFTRYDRTKCERRLSGTQFVHAKTMGDALTRICDRLAGLKDGDPTNDYELMSVAMVGLRGVDCEGGGRLFETQEEFSARVEAKAS